MYLFPGVRFSTLASSISFNSKGLTAGVLNVSEMPTPKRTTKAVAADVEEIEMISNTEKVFYIYFTSEKLPLSELRGLLLKSASSGHL